VAKSSIAKRRKRETREGLFLSRQTIKAKTRRGACGQGGQRSQERGRVWRRGVGEKIEAESFFPMGWKKEMKRRKKINPVVLGKKK